MQQIARVGLLLIRITRVAGLCYTIIWVYWKVSYASSSRTFYRLFFGFDGKGSGSSKVISDSFEVEVIERKLGSSPKS